MVAHVYTRLFSKPSSAPRTPSDVPVPLTGFGVALAGAAIVGALFVTVTEAVPDTPPLDARTVALPLAAGAV